MNQTITPEHNEVIVAVISCALPLDDAFVDALRKMSESGADVHLLSIVKADSNTVLCSNGRVYQISAADKSTFEMAEESDKALYELVGSLGLPMRNLHIPTRRPSVGTLRLDSAIEMIGSVIRQIRAETILIDDPFTKDAGVKRASSDSVIAYLAALQLKALSEASKILAPYGEALAHNDQIARMVSDLFGSLESAMKQDAQLQDKINVLSNERDELVNEISEVRSSTSMRAGRILTAIPRKIKDATKR